MHTDNSSVVSIKNAVIRQPEVRLVQPVNWEIKADENWAVIGPNGSGKTILADLLRGKYPLASGEIIFNQPEKSKNIVQSIAFKDIYSLIDSKTTYYQQRWHSTETAEIRTVRDTLGDLPNKENISDFFRLFNMEEMLEKKIILLSSGELRKFLIVKKLLESPRILILDNPYIGLDATSRIQLVELLSKLNRLEGLQTILLLSNPNDIPETISHILPMKDRECLAPRSKQEFMMEQQDEKKKLFSCHTTCGNLPVSDHKASAHEITVRMENVSIKYGNRTILKDLNWEIRNNEKWALLGQNGAGKSTLLSLIYADNPQSYANTICLFDKKRGSGESIWEIKKKIGYVSPEMHLYYMENVSCLNIVGSGFFDSIGLYRKCNAEQQHIALQWMEVFGIDHLKERSFLTLSSGEQRLALLARVFVKDPDLLILDEPLHGLDISNKKRAASVIENFCKRPGKSMIYVTHYTNEIPSCVTKRFELKKNR